VNWKQLFEKKPTSKTDVGMAIGAVILACYKAVTTIQDYKSEHKEIEK
jgi:hypothetical protein